jgi:DDE superfamily endonuclease
MPAQRKYPDELRERAVRMILEIRQLVPEHRRGHGALYDAVNQGRIDIARLRRSLAGLPLPRAADGRLMLAVDVSNWLRPGAASASRAYQAALDDLTQCAGIAA